MAVHTYFLGANTPKGFVSRYDELFLDERIRKTLIIKGGPGCGKSTLMRSVGREASELGCEVEELLCSSDPDSLDGIVIPAAGLALVDGTAPHVLEPPLCGCGTEYLNLGDCYDSTKLTLQKEQLLALKAKNTACYPFATACFHAASVLNEALHTMAKPEGMDAITVALCGKPSKKITQGTRRTRFYFAFAPSGAISLALPCKTVWTLKDNFCVAPKILDAVADSFTSAGFNVIVGSSPLTPHLISHVIIPEISTAYLTVSDQFTYPHAITGQYDLDVLCMCKFSTAEALHTQQLFHLREQSVLEGLRFLKEAKTYHDALEASCRPAVDFEKVTKKTETVKRLLLKMLSAR